MHKQQPPQLCGSVNTRIYGRGLILARTGWITTDLFINRALVYGTLTGALALIYAGSVIGLHYLLSGVNGDNQLTIVGSTLASAALFQPLRQRIQHTIDQRFYRRKYDTARTVAAFSVTLNKEVDLDKLSEHLLAVVHETMQPAHVSLWLRLPEHIQKSHQHQPYRE